MDFNRTSYQITIIEKSLAYTQQLLLP